MLCLEPPKRKECEGACSRGEGESINGPSRNQQQKKSERMSEKREREETRAFGHETRSTLPVLPSPFDGIVSSDNPLTTKREASEEKKAFSFYLFPRLINFCPFMRARKREPQILDSRRQLFPEASSPVMKLDGLTDLDLERIFF
ncbi:hypothetical protein CEXT_594191 [Caerostris extrusa]|uniref:Uncharacterized protein n=1 Tax=Caerostris extrusa TaxID=172846 RepID=A0AAV4T3X0_CAEEX|nr:hypothetical protein CEXT_594191 [Caerostris extrusa]